MVPIAGLLRPCIAKLGRGRLTGDIAIAHGNTAFYFSMVTSLILGVVLSLVGRMVGR